MKRFWFVFLLLGLLTVFSTSAFAVDLKFSGEFYVAGLYLDKTNLRKDGTDTTSTAFYFQRLRTRTDFIVAPGLTLTTRVDAMERAWGADRNSPSTTLVADSSGSLAENQNIAFDWAYITYVSPIGTFDVGIMNDSETGTIFANSYAPAGRIKWNNAFGSFILKADITKSKDHSTTNNSLITGGSGNTNGGAYSDVDNDKYGLEGVYQWKGGRAGMKVIFYNYAEKNPAPDYYKKKYFVFTPYAIAKIGPVDIQTELNYANGKLKQYDNATHGQDVNLENISGWIDATATFGPVYFGGTIAYVSGDDPTSTDKQEGGTLNGGNDWNPCLILFSYYDRTTWVGPLYGYDTSATAIGASGPMSNAFFVQGRIGVKPIDKLDIMASLANATVDKRPTAGGLTYVGSSYGTELDITATYKITNNLTYIFGLGYLWSGDYFKGTNPFVTVQNDYMVINKLTLTF